MEPESAPSPVTLGGGARFWVQPPAAPLRGSWCVEVEHLGSGWTGAIDSAAPDALLHAAGLEGAFAVRVRVAGPGEPPRSLAPLAGARTELTCGASCAALIGIAGGEDGTPAGFWTVGEALCR